MADLPILAISPLDGRYQNLIHDLAGEFSEYALMRYRTIVEISWLKEMSRQSSISDVRAFTAKEFALLDGIITNFNTDEALRIKEIERQTNHDVKAVEYYLAECLQDTSLSDMRSFLHFCCTSEDINNLAYAMMLRNGVNDHWLPCASEMVDAAKQFAISTRSLPMLARTHGQPATPTTIGKEIGVFVHRWQRQLCQIKSAAYLGKFNGASGCYNAQVAAYPKAPWQDISREFVEGLGLTWNPLTTQIESHDSISELLHMICRFNTITIGFDQDIWSYISLGYIKQRIVPGEVGSSTMPHKVNPINFENSEANLGLSNALANHLAGKLPISRLQRDLSDSSALRSLGTIVGHSVVALQNTIRGLKKLQVDESRLESDLNSNWEILAEPIQTVMRRNGDAEAYHKLKDFSRGQSISRDDVTQFIQRLSLPLEDEKRLLALTPSTYIGLASELINHLED